MFNRRKITEIESKVITAFENYINPLGFSCYYNDTVLYVIRAIFSIIVRRLTDNTCIVISSSEDSSFIVGIGLIRKGSKKSIEFITDEKKVMSYTIISFDYTEIRGYLFQIRLPYRMLIHFAFQSLMKVFKENPGKSMDFEDLFTISSTENGEILFEVDEKIQKYIKGEYVDDEFINTLHPTIPLRDVERMAELHDLLNITMADDFIYNDRKNGSRSMPTGDSVRREVYFQHPEEEKLRNEYKALRKKYGFTNPSEYYSNKPY